MRRGYPRGRNEGRLFVHSLHLNCRDSWVSVEDCIGVLEDTQLILELLALSSDRFGFAQEHGHGVGFVKSAVELKLKLILYLANEEATNRFRNRVSDVADD